MQTSTTKGALMAPWHTIRRSHHMWWLRGLTKYSHRWLCVPEKNQAPLLTHFLKQGRRNKEIKNQPVIQERHSVQFQKWRAAGDPGHGGCSSFPCRVIFLPTTNSGAGHSNRTIRHKGACLWAPEWAVFHKGNPTTCTYFTTGHRALSHPSSHLPRLLLAPSSLLPHFIIIYFSCVEQNKTKQKHPTTTTKKPKQTKKQNPPKNTKKSF